ncbi:MAG: molybdate ABC transporter substrate-binding protein [Pseudohongiellaceae bacterium]|nr:molybdate ABC transporter substrate-binding protein [Pseudohongiellaceae bacterium]
MRTTAVFLLSLCLSGFSAFSGAAEITVAVASNFTSSLEKLRQEFEQQSNHSIRVVSGSSGRLYAQIINGAPFDVFLSADAEKPRALESSGTISRADRRPYALGRLVLWSGLSGRQVTNADVLLQEGVNRVAIANPRVAPYGVAAVETLEALGLFEALSERLVRGENIAQTYQFVESANASLGFVALSQVLERAAPDTYWLIPDNYHRPLVQELAVIRPSEAVAQFLQFMESAAGRAIILDSGYRLPEGL